MNSENRVVDLGDVRVNCIEVGSGTPVISIAPGSQPHLSKLDLMLADRRRVTSFGLGAPPNYELAAKRVTEALGHLNTDQFDLIGYGAGAIVALHIARTAPGVNSLVLIGPKGKTQEKFEDVNCPALTLVGTNDENASLENGHSVTLRLDHSHLMYVYDASLATGDDRSEALAFIVREFMEHRDEFLVSKENGMLFP